MKIITRSKQTKITNEIIALNKILLESGMNVLDYVKAILQITNIASDTLCAKQLIQIRDSIE